jgi:hypothetical protein
MDVGPSRIVPVMPEAKLDPETLELFKRSEAVKVKSLMACHHADLISERLANTLKRNDALMKGAIDDLIEVGRRRKPTR